MAELARIKPQKAIACPGCRKVLPDFSVDEVVEGKPRCPHCGQRIKLPDELIERAKQQRYLGNNFDFTC